MSVKNSFTAEQERYLRQPDNGHVPLIRMVGAEGFEPPTLCSQSRCATRLRYAPTAEIVSQRIDMNASIQRCANQPRSHTIAMMGAAKIASTTPAMQTRNT
jgi:hypothetical protein